MKKIIVSFISVFLLLGCSTFSRMEKTQGQITFSKSTGDALTATEFMQVINTINGKAESGANTDITSINGMPVDSITTLLGQLDSNDNVDITDEPYYGGGGTGTGFDSTPLTSAPSSPVTGQWYVASAASWNPCGSNSATNYLVQYIGGKYVAGRKVDGTNVYMTDAPGVGDADECLGVVGQKIWADNSNWDPDPYVTGTDPYEVYNTLTGYISVMRLDGALLLSQIPMIVERYSETATVSENDVFGSSLDNYGQSTDSVLTMPQPEPGMNAIFNLVDISNSVTFRPYTGERFIFEDSTGTKSLLAVDQGVECAVSGMVAGDQVSFLAVPYGDTTYRYKVTQISGGSCAAE